MSEQYIDLPNLYVNGLGIVSSGSANFLIEAGRCRDSTNSFDIVIDTPKVLRGGIVGVDGLDTGVLAPNTSYYIYVIYDNTLQRQAATLLSTSATAPVLPYNYSNFRRIGFGRTNSGAVFFPFFQKNSNLNVGAYQYTSATAMLTGGTATTFTSIGSFASYAPISVRRYYLEATFTPNVVTDVASIRSVGSAATAGNTPIVMKSNVAGVSLTQQVTIVPILRDLEYMVTSASDSLSLRLIGFEDAL